MRTVIVSFEGGNHIVTSINGTTDEIEDYYFGRAFELDEGKPLVYVTRIEFLDNLEA